MKKAVLGLERCVGPAGTGISGPEGRCPGPPVHLGLSDLDIGGVWTGMALAPLADRFWPMLAASAPFLLVDLLAKFYFEGKR